LETLLTLPATFKKEIMVCPICLVQMHQKDKIGGGRSEEDYYETWEVKECPSCGRLYEEYYRTRLISDKTIERLLDEKSRKNKSWANLGGQADRRQNEGDR